MKILYSINFVTKLSLIMQLVLFECYCYSDFFCWLH